MSLRGMSGVNDEAIYNAYTSFKIPLLNFSVCKIMDCHEHLRFSRNDNKPTTLSLRDFARSRGNP